MGISSLYKSYFIFGILIASLSSIVLGGLVLMDSPRRKVNRLFSLLCFLFSLWGVSFIGFNLTPGTVVPQFWGYVFVATLLSIPPVYFHIVIGSLGVPFKGGERAMPPFADRLRQLGYVAGAGVFVLIKISSPEAAIPRGPAFFSFPYLSPQFWLATIVFVGLFSYALKIVQDSIARSTDPNQKNRLAYLQIGTVTLLLAGLANFLLIRLNNPHWHWIWPLVHLASSVCLGFIAYALTTSQLYHFTEIFRKTIAFMAMTLILLTVFGGTHFLATRILLPFVPNSDFFALGTSSILMSLVFHPLRFRVQNIVDRFFFSKRFDQMQRLRGLSRRVLSSADREELLNILFTSLLSMGFGSATLLLKDPQKGIFQIRKQAGLASGTEGFFLRTDSLLVQYLREEKEEFIRDEVTRRILADWERQALGEEMDILQSEIVFPLFSSRKRALFGILTLGNSDLGYSSYKGRNIFWLKSVIDNAGIMLDNFYHQEFASALVPYVGRTWADEMRRNKDGFRERLQGHRTWVSVLMVDIRHFTMLTNKMDPRYVVSLLKDFRSHVAPIVYRHQGTIDKFIGDAIMIVFGLPILPPVPSADKNAVQCADEILREMAVLNNHLEAAYKERISVGIGVSSGDVIAGNVDSGDRVEYTVIGEAANMVARLEDLAGDNQILISPATHARVKHQFNFNAWAPRKITGFDEPVTVYELLPSLPAVVTNQENISVQQTVINE